MTGKAYEIALTGEISLNFKKVDKYNDATRLGIYLNGSGQITVLCGAISVESPEIPVPVPYLPPGSVKVKATASMAELQGSLGMTGVAYDESSASPQLPQIQYSLGSTVSVGATVVLGNVIEIAGKGGVTWNASLSGPGQGYPNNIVLTGNVVAPQLKVEITGYVEAGPLDFEFFRTEHIFGTGVNIPLGPFTVWTRT